MKLYDKVKIISSTHRSGKPTPDQSSVGKIATIYEEGRDGFLVLVDGKKEYFFRRDLAPVYEPPTFPMGVHGVCLNEKTMEDQLKEAEELFAKLKRKLDKQKSCIDRYEYEFYAGSCNPILHKGGVPFDAAIGLGIRCWNGTKTDECDVKYKLTLERIEE